MMVVEQGVLSRERQGSASWYHVFIVREVIASWLWLVSLLGAGAVGVYIAYTTLRGNTVGTKDMEITHYDSIFGLMKDISDGLWDAGFCLLQ